MKKYLMTGVAALAFAATFTSCSKGSDLYDEGKIEQQKEATVNEKYAAAFEKAFGKVGANVDWGFSSQAKTRATGEFADHVGAYPDANMWTSKGFLAPDPLTTAQKLRVQYYFQMNKITNPNRPDNGVQDFFMQQVYTGGTDAMDGKSAERYKAADPGTMIVGGIHMDHLTVGPNALHTFNFNHGTCSTNDNVANRTSTNVNDTEQQHSDQIQLMLNTPTSCFGYANSEASCVRNDRWTLVAGSTIDNFCDNDSNFKTWLANRLPSNETDKKVVDDFNRSFIGFDFDMLPDTELYQGQAVDKDGNPVWDTYNDKDKIDHIEYSYFSIDLNGQDKVWDGEKLVDASTVGVFENGKFYPYMPGTTLKVHNTNPNGNQYCGTYENNWSDDDWKHTVSVNGQNTVYTSIAKMTTALKAGKLPKGGATKEWIAFGNCADGYYTDWIVSFMPASSEPVTHLYRVIAEDLSATESGDFDFNDVVFDVVSYDQSKDETTLRLIACGGTLPLMIGSNNGVGGVEVHSLYGENAPDATTGKYNMWNTIAGKNSHDPVDFEISGEYTTPEQLLALRIEVQKNDTWMLLTATKGKAACKILVDDRFPIVPERTSIANAQGNFTTYVTGNWKENDNFWWIQAK